MELDSNQRRTWCSSAVQQTAALSHSAIHPCRCWSRGGDSHPCRLHGTQASLLLNDRDVVEPRPGVEPGPAGLGNRLESASRGVGAPWSIRTAAFGFEARRSSTELRGQRVLGGPGTAAQKRAKHLLAAAPNREPPISGSAGRRQRRRIPRAVAIRCGIEKVDGAGDRNRTCTPLLTRQSLTRVELRRRLVPRPGVEPGNGRLRKPA